MDKSICIVSNPKLGDVELWSDGWNGREYFPDFVGWRWPASHYTETRAREGDFCLLSRKWKWFGGDLYGFSGSEPDIIRS